MHLVSNQQELSMLMYEARQVQYQSQYNFIKEHGGYRKGKLHLAIGPSSGGKSTLTRSLLIDFLLTLKPDEKVHLHLSEESYEEFLIEIASSGLDLEKINRISVTSEQDNQFKSANELFRHLHEALSESKVRGLFFDNITTSFCYMDRKADQQALVSHKLKTLAKGFNIPFVLIGHTGGDSTMASTRLIEMNDIRGGKSIVNLVEFMYVLQPLFVGDSRYNIIRILKHRGYSIKNSYFQLEYSDKARMFACDEAISFESFKSIFKQRNVL